jgi:predicted nuclease of predicted toxin-antitoxin system
MRYFLDEDFSGEVARIARNLGLVVCSVHEVAGREGLDDAEQFDYAVEHGMVMVTRNRDDFLILNDEHHQAGTPNCGLLIVPHSLPNNQPVRIAHRLREWNSTKEAAPGSFGSYVYDFL